MNKVNLFRQEQQFIDRLESMGGQPLYKMSPKEARSFLREIQKNTADNANILYKNITIATGRGREMPVLLLVPQGIEDELPLIFYLHGGGWVMGDEYTHHRLITHIALTTPAAVAFPIYDNAPEGQFPEVLDDLYKVFCELVKNGAQYGVKTKETVVMGDSAGANMATVLTFMAKENGFYPSIKLQILLYPVLDAAMDSASYKTFRDGPWLSQKAMEWFFDMYAPDKEKRLFKEISPARAVAEELKCLPSALIITAENDVLRDEGERYAQKLDEAGVLAASVRFNGTMHDFLMLNALSDTPAAQAALSLVVAQLRRFLYGVR